MLKLTAAQAGSRIDNEAGFVQWFVDGFMPEHLPEFHAAFRRERLLAATRRGRRVAERLAFTPVGGPGKREWADGFRGDGTYKPDPGSDLGLELADFSKNPALNPGGKASDGIPYRNGFPDYGAVVVPAGVGKKAEVEIIQAGNHTTDFSTANDALVARQSRP